MAVSRMPSFFIPHGAGPCFFMDWAPPDTWNAMAGFLRGLPASLPEPPRAILMVSAHWLTPTFATGSGAKPALIYDYRGFPPHTYSLRYDAPGDPALAAQAATLLREAGLPATTDAARGFDHGVFIPLKVMFPDAHIPVAPLSIRADLNAAAHVAAGAALAALRDQGVLILGSGMSFHNMRGYGDPGFTTASETFDAWLGETLAMTDTAARGEKLAAWDEAPCARQCHPPGEEEHLLPLMIAAGAGGPGHRVFSDVVLQTRISAFRFD